MTTDPTPPADRAAGDVRDQLLHALDFNYVASLGYGTPEELLAAYDASRASVDRAALRDRIADILAAADGWTWVPSFDKTRSPAYQGYQSRADAVLAVLPPADWASILRKAADVAESLRQFEPAFGARKSAQVSENVGILRVAEQLRRMADETATTETPARDCPACDARIPHTEHCPTPESHNWGCGCPGDRLPLYSDRGVDTPGCDCGHPGMGMRWHSEACLWIGSLVAEARELLAKPEQPAAGARQDETAADEPERCAHCAHPKSDHDGRADHRARYSPLVAGEPWCHACNAPCDYAAAGARQDGAQATALDVLRCLANPEPCAWEGVYCVTHSWKSDVGRCPHGQAQALLGASRTAPPPA